MFLRASDYPAVFRREEVFYIVHVFDLVSLLDFVQLPIEPHKYALAEQDTVVILFEANIVYTTIIDREDLPVRFYLQFQFRSQVKPHHVKYEMQCFLAGAKGLLYHPYIGSSISSPQISPSPFLQDLLSPSDRSMRGIGWQNTGL